MLLKTKRFLPLMITQFLGALNDNLFKNALLTLVTVKMTAQSDILSNLIAGLFILPFFLFSAMAGQLADKYPRDKIARVLKITELLLMLGVAAACYRYSLSLLIVIMTLMGAQSAFFGPVKYALLPQHLKPEELIAGNAYIESTTYMAILLGLILGTLLPIEVTIGLLILLAAAGWLSARQIPPAPSPRPELKVSANLFASTLENFRFLLKHRQVFMSILGATWFWTVGALVAVQIYPLCGKILNAGEGVITLFLVLFSVGVAVGSYCCNRLLKGFVHTTYVPLSAVGMGVSLFLLYLFTDGYPTPAEKVSFAAFFSRPHAFGLSFNLFALAFWGGMYIIPLNAFMQSRAPKAYVATVIAGNNIFNALGMALSAFFAVVFLSLGFTLPQLFLAASLACAVVSVYICALLPDALTRSLVQSLLGFLFRSKVSGIANFKRAGSKVLIVSNHVSLLDGVLLAAFMPERITFAINTGWTQKWFIPVIRLLVDFYPVDPANPLSVRSLAEEIKKGRKVMIFPEGRVTTTGAMMKVYEGAGVIAAKAGAKILPVRINGAQYSKFSYLKDKFPTRWFPKITLNILEPCRFPAVSAGNREARHKIARRLYNLMAEMMYKTTESRAGLSEALVFAAKTHGRRHIAAIEPGKRPLTFGRLLRESCILSAFVRRSWPAADRIGLLNPAGIDGLVSLFAVLAAGKTVVMLEEEDCSGSLPCLPPIADIRLSVLDRIRGLGCCIRRRIPRIGANDPAVVLPGNVTLTHRNLLAGCSQLGTVLPFNAKDKVAVARPPSTVIGLVPAVLLPLFSGSRLVFCPHPSQYRQIAEICYDAGATVLFGDEALFAGCGEAAHQYDFFSLRHALSDAFLTEKTFELWVRKFGVRILSGLILPAAGAFASFNTPLYNRLGTCGSLLPGVSYRDGVLKSDSFSGREIKPDKVLTFDEDGYVLTN